MTQKPIDGEARTTVGRCPHGRRVARFCLSAEGLTSPHSMHRVAWGVPSTLSAILVVMNDGAWPAPGAYKTEAEVTPVYPPDGQGSNSVCHANSTLLRLVPTRQECRAFVANETS